MYSLKNHGSPRSICHIKPVMHIGFLDFTLFEAFPECYATNMMVNVKNYHIYSSKIVLSVGDLTHIDIDIFSNQETVS